MENGMKLGRLIKQLNLIFEANRNAFLKEYDITSSQMDILEFLSEQEDTPAQMKTIVAYLGSSYATVSGLIDRMVKKDLLVYVMSESDKRAREVCMSDTGKYIYEQSHEYLEQLDQKAVQHFSRKDQDQLTQYLQQLETNLK